MSAASRLRALGVVSLLGVAVLAACGKPESADTPAAARPPAVDACQVPHFYSAGQLSKADEELFAAAAAGNVRLVEESIAAGANLNATGSLKRTPLFAAAFCDRPAVARLLLDKGGQVDLKDANGMSSLHAAVIVGAVDTARVLIGKGADINIRDASRHTPLHLAAATDQTPLVELLLQGGADAAARDGKGMTAAALAADNGHDKPAAAIKDWQQRLKPKTGR